MLSPGVRRIVSESSCIHSSQFVMSVKLKVNASAERLSSSDVLIPSKKAQQVLSVQPEAYLTKVLIRQTCSFKIGSRMAQCELSSTVHCEIWGTATSKDLLELR